MKDTVRFPLVLGVICIVAAAALSATYLLTRDRMREQERQARDASLIAIFGPGVQCLVARAGEEDEETIYRVLAADGAMRGYAALGEAQGYASPLKVMVGVGPDAKRLVGIEIMAEKETPGLGSRVEEVKSDVTWIKIIRGAAPPAGEPQQPWFQEQFRGAWVAGEVDATSGATTVADTDAAADRKPWTYLRADAAGKQQAVEAISGATVTSKAVFRAVQNGVEKIRDYLAQSPAAAAGGQ